MRHVACATSCMSGRGLSRKSAEFRHFRINSDNPNRLREILRNPSEFKKNRLGALRQTSFHVVFIIGVKLSVGIRWYIGYRVMLIFVLVLVLTTPILGSH